MRQFLRSLKEIRKYIHRGSAQDVVIVCPICLGDILEVIPNILPLLSPPIYSCPICGYRGAIFAEIKIDQYEKLTSMIETDSSGR
ncbi:MAG: hypothetical protein ACFFB2_00815 [Promethearchaeota archaeon]